MRKKARRKGIGDQRKNKGITKKGGMFKKRRERKEKRDKSDRLDKSKE